MKSEKLFEAFTELDDDLIENAMPQNPGERDYDVVKPGQKMNSWKPWVAGAAVAAAAFGVVFAGFKLFGGGKPIIAPAVETSEGSNGIENSGVAADEVKYSSMSADWVVYDTVEDLVNASDIICDGKVNGISFALIDPRTGMEIEDGDDPKNGELYTVYDIHINRLIRNSSAFNKGRIWFRVQGGIKDYKVDEQLELVRKTGSDTIMLMSNPPEIELGREYLFLLADFDYAPVGGGRMPTIINNTQTAFPLSKPNYRDSFSGASVNDILEYLGENHHGGGDDHYAEMLVTHNNQIIPLSDNDYDTLVKAIQTIVTNCNPENALTTVLTEQDVEKYGKSGYAIDIVFDDIDAPLANGGNDKKAQTICHATVLIGGENESSYVSCSYTVLGLDGSTEQHHGGTYLLNTTHRRGLLGCIGECSLSHNNCINHHDNETSHHDEPEHTTVAPTPAVTPTTGTHHDEPNETHH